MGVHSLAKTLLVSRLAAETMNLTFSRISSPDLMPMDITGTDILQESASGRREFEFVKGPVFANIVLADEINRAPSKTQAAMLEAMQEHRVTVIGRTYHLEPPFFVLATQNPVEQEGTYPLPEAQLDRFMFLINVDYPSRDEEITIARTTTGGKMPELEDIIDAERSSVPGTRAPRSRAAAHLRVCCRPDTTNSTERCRRTRLAEPVGCLGSRSASCQYLVPRCSPSSLTGSCGASGRRAGSCRPGADPPSADDLRRRVRRHLKCRRRPSPGRRTGR